MKQPHGVALAAALAVVGCGSTPARPVPDALRPAANEAVLMTISASGVQIYECRVAADATKIPAWVFVAPEADLFDAEGRRIGRHGAGPVWQAQDGSRIVGQVRARADAPTAGAIPWLLLTTQSTGTPGAFSRVTSIQRIHTVGGLAPTLGCTPERASTPARIPYTADYRFFATR